LFSTRGCLPKAPQRTFTAKLIIMSNARRFRSAPSALWPGSLVS
jgi:hypothetical protein